VKTQETDIRWMIRRDMPEVLAIESESFRNAWDEQDFVRCLRQRNCIGMVVEADTKITGYMIYELHRTRLHVLNFAVRPDVRRRGVGSEMVRRLIGKLSADADRRNRILLEVRETNLDAQLFFRACGFRATEVLNDFYGDSDEQAYQMQLRHSDTFAAVELYK
jgi:[ribosomal protein S18]-alanine N-acetyltransferase